MRFFHPRPLHLVESLTLIVAIFLLMTASVLTDRDGWFSTSCWWLQNCTVWWLLCCQIASSRVSNYFMRKLEEQHLIIGELRASFPHIDTSPRNEEELAAVVAKVSEHCDESAVKARAAVARMHELIEEWKTYP